MKNDLSLYEEFAEHWHDTKHPVFRSLHTVNDTRLQMFNDWVGDIYGKRIIDLGCGGGLMALPICERGADVVGVDLSVASMQMLQRVAECRLQLVAGDCTSCPLTKNFADIVLLADVVDHLPDYPKALAEGYRLLRDGGLLFVSTLSRTFFSYVTAIVLGEGLRLVPRGTHDHRLFIQPRELETACRELGFVQEQVQGFVPVVLPTLKTWSVHLRRSKSQALAYAALFRKRGNEA